MLSKKRCLSRNVDIFGYMAYSLNFDIFEDMCKKRIVLNDLKKLTFSRNVDFFEHLDKNIFVFQRNQMKNTNCLNFDIFGDMGKQRFLR